MDTQTVERITLDADDLAQGKYACPGCPETFVTMGDKRRHMKVTAHGGRS